MAEAAAKEPTMEDILASIRKIISQDDARGRSPAAPPPPPAAPRPVAAAAPASGGNSFVDRMAQTSAPAAAQPPAGKVSSLAALASQVKSQMPRTSEGFRPAPQAVAPQPRPEPKPEPRPAQPAPAAIAPRPEPVRAAPQPAAPQPAAAAPVARQAPEPVRPAPQPAAAIVAAGPRPAPEPVASAPAPGAAAQPRHEGEVRAFRDALVSPSTENAVNGSVERLRKALADGADAKFEAVLRPMLREWMDENLPRMVERVVREEIDRIVRQG